MSTEETSELCFSELPSSSQRENSHSSELLREHKPFKNASLSILLQNEISKDDEVRFFSTKVLIETIILCAEIMVCLCLRYQDVLFVCVKQ